MFIKLRNGMKAIIDAEDWDRIKHLKWGFGYGCSKKTGYSQYVGANQKNYRGQVLLHRLIVNTPKGFHTDHINGNTLDNRKSNLRICTPSQNQRNARKKKSFSSKYKGVCWFKRDGCWRANIWFNKHQLHLGYFESEIDAAKAYNKKAKEFYKEFAFINPL